MIERQPRTKTAARKQDHGMAPHPADPDPSGDALTPRKVYKTVHDSMPEDTIVVEESPSSLADLHSVWPSVLPDTFYTAASGGLGFSLPASVGIALGERDSGRNRPVVAMMGDGSFNYSIQSIWTAAQHDLPIIFMVLRNGEYAILKSFAVLEESPGVPGLDVTGIDFVSLGNGYGCASVQANTVEDITAAVNAAMKRQGPTLIEVEVASTVPPLI